MTAFRVLVVDDDDLVRDTVSDALRLSGYEVLNATDGLAGAYRAREANPDLILLDVQMPQQDGFETLRVIRSDPVIRDIPVVMLSSLRQAHIKVKALEAGADDYVMKDAPTVELIARVRATLRRASRYRRIEGSLAGSIEEIGLDALLQTLQIGMRSAKVRLPDIGGEIVLHRGGLHSCSFRRFTGSDALVRLFLVARGKFVVQTLELPQQDPIPQGASLSSALVDALVELDEARVLLEKVPSLSTPLAINPVPTAIAPLEAIRTLFPMSVVELVITLESDVRSNAAMVASAFESGALRSVEQ